ncbi:MAG: peptidylprolyl isomerase [Solirubrobacterales bacterium]|nr:peptidylprolyl isomerase [Solirubrobacterales bacterium]
MSVARLRTELSSRCVAVARGAVVLSVLLPATSSAVAGTPMPAACPPTASVPSPATPLTPPPEQVVACIGAQPITGAAFSHWAAIAAKAVGPPGKGRPPPSAAAVKQEVMSFLISSNWVLGEAQDLGLHVTEAEVRHSFDHIRDQQFHTRREFHAFLRASGETLGDLVFRLRLNLTSVRIQRHIVAGHHGTRSKERALETFVVNFKRKWQAQTSCASQFAVPDCGRVY